MLSPELLFRVANTLALVGWALLALAPRRAITRRLVLSGALPLLLAGSYAVLIVYQTVAHPAPGAGFNSLAEVTALFRQPWALLAGWVHYLCFDLWVGIWEINDAQRRGLRHPWLLPCLLLTFLLGPLGLLLYHVVRRWTGNSIQ